MECKESKEVEPDIRVSPTPDVDYHCRQCFTKEYHANSNSSYQLKLVEPLRKSVLIMGPNTQGGISQSEWLWCDTNVMTVPKMNKTMKSAVLLA